MEKLFVFGHKSPDTDSICSSIVMTNLQNKLGAEATCYRLGEISKETDYVLNYFHIPVPELLENIEEGSSVILVDHNEFTQSVTGIEKAKIKMVVDHHRINRFETPEPLTYLARPVGCTATILYQLYQYLEISIDKSIAGLMLSAILSDTLLLKSPTTTKEDEDTANKLAKIAEIDISTYGLAMLKAGTDLEDLSASELIELDTKEFEIKDFKIQVSQVNTVCIEDVLKCQTQIEEEMQKSIQEKSLELFMFVITDILECNSKAIVLGNKTDLVEKSYGVKIENNVAFLPGVVSRKKQIIPILTQNA